MSQDHYHIRQLASWDVGGGWDDESDDIYRRRQIALRFMLKRSHGLGLKRNGKNEPDVKVDPAWRKLGKNHADRELGLVEGYGGEQERKPMGEPEHPHFAVPYRPALSSEVVHPSGRR